MKKQVTKEITKNKIQRPKSDHELPVTKRLLDLTKQELKSDITTLRLEMKAGFNMFDAKINDIKLDVTAQISVLDTKITKMMILMEDQNDRNRATLDANTMVYEKIVDNDSRVEKLEERVFGRKQR